MFTITLTICIFVSFHLLYQYYLIFYRPTMTLATQILYTVALAFLSVDANIVQNCTTNSCDLKTCANTTQACMQKCYTSNCRMSCVSPMGCNMQCTNGGCSRLFCDVPKKEGIVSICYSVL